jgi:hypothetical protein
MSRINNILGQLQDKLSWKYGKSIEEDFLSHYTKDDEDIENPEAVDTPYITHRPFILPTGGKRGNKLPFESKNIKEQEEDEAESPEKMASKAAETGEDLAGDVPDETGDIPGETGGMGGETGGMGSMGDVAGGMGMGMGMEPEEPKTAGQLGRIYELKKIYSRLTSIESYLGNESTPELLEIRNLVSKSIELFEIISSNFDSYKEKLDDIIITYYKFILEVYKEVTNYFKKEARSGD